MFKLLQRMKLTLLLIVNIRHAGAEQQILTAGVFRNRQITQEGTELTLSCSVYRPWFLCVWQTPAADRQCALSTPQVSSVCENTRMSIGGTSDNCTLSFTVNASDHGVWMCLVTYDGDFDTQRMFVDLEVALTPQLKMERIAPEEENLTEGIEEEILGTDGEMMTLRCSAERSHPRPDFLWVLNRKENESHVAKDCNTTLSTSQESTVVSLLPHNYWVNSYQDITLNITEDLNGTTLYCIVRLPDVEGETVVETSIGTQITVVPGPRFIHIRSGADFFPFLVILVLSVTSCCLCLLLVPLVLRRKPSTAARQKSFSTDISTAAVPSPLHSCTPVRTICCSRGYREDSQSVDNQIGTKKIKEAKVEQTRNSSAASCPEPDGWHQKYGEPPAAEQEETTPQRSILPNRDSVTANRPVEEEDKEEGEDAEEEEGRAAEGDPSNILAGQAWPSDENGRVVYGNEVENEVGEWEDTENATVRFENETPSCMKTISPAKDNRLLTTIAIVTNQTEAEHPNLDDQDDVVPIGMSTAEADEVDNQASAAAADDYYAGGELDSGRNLDTEDDDYYGNIAGIEFMDEVEEDWDKRSVFYCEEGCFRISDSCQHQNPVHL